MSSLAPNRETAAVHAAILENAVRILEAMRSGRDCQTAARDLRGGHVIIEPCFDGPDLVDYRIAVVNTVIVETSGDWARVTTHPIGEPETRQTYKVAAAHTFRECGYAPHATW